MKPNLPGRLADSPEHSDAALLRRLVHDYLGRQKLSLALAIVCMVGGAAMQPLLAWLVNPAIKLIFEDKRTDMLVVIPAAVILVVVVRAALNFGETALTQSIGQRIAAQTQRDMVRSLIKLDLQRLNLVHSGQFISHFLYDATLLRDAVTKGIAAIAKEFMTLTFLVALMLYENWALTLVSAVMLPIIAWVTKNLGRSVRKASTRGMVETSELSTALSEVLDGRRIVKAYGLEAHAAARTEGRIDARLSHLMKSLADRALSAPAADFFGGIARAGGVLF